MKRHNRFLILLLLPVLLAALLTGCQTQPEQTRQTLDDYGDATLGIMSGTIADDIARERYPDCSIEYYPLLPDLILAVEQGKVDAFFAEITYIIAARWEGAPIRAVDGYLYQSHAAFIFPKGASPQLQEQLNAFIRQSKENGVLEGLEKKWLGDAEPTEHPDLDSLTGENGTLRIAVAPDLKPIAYVKDGRLTGLETEFMVMFAREYGYRLDASMMAFDAILPGVTSGKYDIGTGAITITEERKESLDFSESHLIVDATLAVQDEARMNADSGFWAALRENFEKTFIRENRWKLIAEGMGITLLISLSAGVFGSLLGFGLYMLSRTELRLLQRLAVVIGKVYTRIVAGTPVIVVLMILFYVVFGSFRDISGVLVAIIAFSLVFGSFVYGHLTVSVSSIDRGQTEAAYALGYSRNKAFFRIVLPQAMTIFLPSYCGQAVELVKATAVVGYVAVNDLTKMGDIIRSNTYEAFFPLLATAVIYFLLTWLLALALRLLTRQFEPKRRRREQILRGLEPK